MRDRARSIGAVRINKFKGKQIKVSFYRTKNSVCPLKSCGLDMRVSDELYNSNPRVEEYFYFLLTRSGLNPTCLGNHLIPPTHFNFTLLLLRLNPTHSQLPLKNNLDLFIIVISTG